MSYLTIQIPIKYDLMKEMLSRAEDEGTDIENLIISLLNKEFLDNKAIELNEVEVSDVVNEMIDFANNHINLGQTFKANELYLRTFGTQWTKLSPSARKSLGRRFRIATNELWNNAEEGEIVIQHEGKNINNAAYYAMVSKVDL